MMKRTFDILLAAFGLVVCSPLLLVAAVLVRLSSPGPILFRQQRVGRGFRTFSILKFRSMTQDAPKRGGQITFGEDPRITRFGRILRKTKMDEFPQLFNVLRGDMSFVGPRPEVPRYVEMFRSDYEEVLRVRPGVTDLASIKFFDEAALLGQADDPEREYVSRVLPEKIRLAKEYVARSSLGFDLSIIVRTMWRLIANHVSRPANAESTEAQSAESQSAGAKSACAQSAPAAAPDTDGSVDGSIRGGQE